MPELNLQRLIDQQRTQQMDLVNSQFNKAMDELKATAKNEIDALNNQYKIQQNLFRARWGALPRTEEGQSRRRSLFDQWQRVRAQFEGRLQAITDKIEPSRKEIELAKTEAGKKLQRRFDTQDTQIATVQALVNRGILQPGVGLQQELGIIGVDIPLSQLIARGPSLEQQKSALEDDIRDMKALVAERFVPPVKHGFFEGFYKRHTGRGLSMKDPITGKVRELDPAKADDKRMIETFNAIQERLKNAEIEYGNILAKANPAIQSVIERRNARLKAMKALRGTRVEGGGLGPSFMKKLEDNPETKATLPPIGQTIADLRSKGLGREQIRQILVNMGYK